MGAGLTTLPHKTNAGYRNFKCSINTTVGETTGRSGDAALKPYAPTGTKKKGEGKVKVLYKTHINVYLCIVQIATISDSSLTV